MRLGNRTGVECIGNSKIYHNCLLCILVDKQLRKWYGKENIYMEVVDLSTLKSPNKEDLEDALSKAFRIYRNCMRFFIVRHLRRVPGETPEDLIANALSHQQADQFWAILDKRDDIESAIDFSYFPPIIQKNWLIEQNRQNYGFAQQFDSDMTFQSRLWLIRAGRNIGEHEDTKIDSEFVRTHLFHIAEVLGKINSSDEQGKVEKIRDELFSDDTAERLMETEERLKAVEADNAKHKKTLSEVEQRLAATEVEKSEYEQKNAALSEQVDTKEKQRKKLDRQLKNAQVRNDKRKTELAGVKQRLEKSEAERTDHKKHLKTISKELEVMKIERSTSEERLTATSNELASVQVNKDASEKHHAVPRNLLTTVAIGDQAVFPPLGTDAAARILDRRNTEKKNYLLDLLEQKQPTIIYVQSEEKIDQLLTLVGPEKAKFIGEHNAQTSTAEDTEILEKLRKGELTAIVSDTAFSTSIPSHCVEHFVFCHLAPSSEAFFDRCQPAFTSEKNTYLHLIYNSEQDMEGLTQKYPDREMLEKLYPELTNLAETNGNFITIGNLYSESGIAKLSIETGLAIFEELQLLERNGENIKLLPPTGKKLDESGIYLRGEKLKKETADFGDFQFEHSIEQIWEKMLEKLKVDNSQMLHDSRIHKMPLRVSETEEDYLMDYQTQSEKSTEVVEKDSAASDVTLEAGHTAKLTRANVKAVSRTTKGKSREKKPSISERYVADTTKEDRNQVAVKVVEMRINAAGSKRMSWRQIREKLGLKNDQFHKVIRHSPGYRKAVIDRIQKLRARPEGWEYSGKLEVLTGIQISDSELKQTKRKAG